MQLIEVSDTKQILAYLLPHQQYWEMFDRSKFFIEEYVPAEIRNNFYTME